MQPAKFFRQELRESFESFIEKHKKRFPRDEVLRVDLHCHDRNSDVPDELIGRILRSRETWTSTKEVVDTLKSRGVDLVTLTNHNNARSCRQLQDAGLDVLPGAEFTCRFIEHDAFLHVLTYGFTGEQEATLERLRTNLHSFLEYAAEENLPTILAHPLFFSSKGVVPDFSMFEKLSVMFQNFEGVNGQRDAWQNLMLAGWIESLDEEKIEQLAKKTGIPADRYCRRPYVKALTGGSDDHMAMFAGLTGTLLHVPGLAQVRKRRPLSALALEALREGRTAPYGSYSDDKRLAAAFLDFFFQATIHLDDPGLLRMMLHRGDAKEKLAALAIANFMMELRRHRFTFKFIKTAHEALHGKRAGFMVRRSSSKSFRPLVRQLDELAVIRKTDPNLFETRLDETVSVMFRQILEVLAERITAKLSVIQRDDVSTVAAATKAVEKLELPAHLRTLFDSKRGDERSGDTPSASLAELTDGLPFPALAAGLLGAASFASLKVMFNNRPLLEEFSKRLGAFEHPKRVLWLTDSFFDNNGVASSLQLLHDEVCKRDLPIDFVVADSKASSRDHLIVLKPVVEVNAPIYENQPFRFFDLIELQRVFVEGGYDRVVCSTEAPMGLAALYLKLAFSVPAYFYLHTDWIDFSERKLEVDGAGLDRVRRLLRAFYKQFDGLFVLNREQIDWLGSKSMGIPKERLHYTAHWSDPEFHPWPVDRGTLIPDLDPQAPVIMYAGRLSEEKGVMELPVLMERIRGELPAARLVIAGTGPASEKLKRLMPDAVMTGWVNKTMLAKLYSAADVLVLPSRFDTFGCVVLEAMSCGLPVVAYRTKGPKDIIEHDRSGCLAEDLEELAAHTTALLRDRPRRSKMRLEARARAGKYNPDRIVRELLRDLRLEHAFASPRQGGQETLDYCKTGTV